MVGVRRSGWAEAMKKQGKKPKRKRARRYVKGLGLLRAKINERRIQ